MYSSSDLVKALNSGNFLLATELYNSGIKLTFIKTMITQFKKNNKLDKLKWIYLYVKPKLSVEELKYAFTTGDSIFIIITWNLCEDIDFIDTVDILEIIINKSVDNELFNLLTTLRNKSLKLFNPQIELFMKNKLNSGELLKKFPIPLKNEKYFEVLC